MASSETFGVEQGFGPNVVKWINEQALKLKVKLETREYGYEINTQNFGTFEMISWMGDVNIARSFIIKASKRFKIKIIEGGYKTKERTFTIKKRDYAIVRKGERIIGHLEFSTGRFGLNKWELISEERV